MGKAFTFGDNIDTDVIVPGRYLSLTEPADLGKICMIGHEEGFSDKIARGDVFVVGDNFGCGSSREHAPVSIKAAGVAYIIGKSFARIFYRNAINLGLPLIESKEAVRRIREGDEIEVNPEKGEIRNLTRNETYAIPPIPPFIMGIVEAGGMVPYVRNRKQSRR